MEEAQHHLEPTLSFQVAADEFDTVLPEPTRPATVVEAAAAAPAEEVTVSAPTTVIPVSY